MGHARWASKTAAAGRRGVTSGGRGVPGAGCRVYGVAQSTTAEPRRSLDSAISERAAPLQPQLVLPTPALPLFGPAAKTKAARRGTCV